MELKLEVTNDSLNISTDHYPIVFEIPLFSDHKIMEERSFRKTKEIVLDNFKHEFQEICDTLDFSTDTNFYSIFNSFQLSSLKLTEKRTCNHAKQS